MVLHHLIPNFLVDLVMYPLTAENNFIRGLINMWLVFTEPVKIKDNFVAFDVSGGAFDVLVRLPMLMVKV